MAMSGANSWKKPLMIDLLGLVIQIMEYIDFVAGFSMDLKNAQNNEQRNYLNFLKNP